MGKTYEKRVLEVVVDGIADNPRCAHGPTVLFVRGSARYFSCSAYRNKKHCSFRLDEEEWRAGRTRSVRPILIDHENAFENFQRVKSGEDGRRYCHTCSTHFLSYERHPGDHRVTGDLTREAICCPSNLLEPLESNQKEAQYFFSDESAATIVKILVDNNFRSVLCIGTPRIHEYIKRHSPNGNMQSLLLDIDVRLCNFFGPDEFCLYNLFNDFFFQDGEKTLTRFLSKNRDVCCVMDPPFGGRIELFDRTLSNISMQYFKIHNYEIQSILPTVLVLPYFMEPQVKNYLSVLEMSDYQVTYTNHKSFQNDHKNKSPVRIFTNIPLEEINLSHLEGYKYCDACKKWIGNWNEHCSVCNACTSKNGTTYKHCSVCNRCVKTSWIHCVQCQKCALRDHHCEIIPFKSKCFKCKEYGHKQSECLKSQDNKFISKKSKTNGRNIAKVKLKKCITKEFVKMKSKRELNK